jgi:hypothetical protein
MPVFFPSRKTGKGLIMKKLMTIMGLCFLALALGACASSTCEVEPIVEQNHKLIVPPNFGNQPK